MSSKDKQKKCCCCIKGPRGPRGPQGPQGDDGKQGKAGQTGQQGSQGQPGASVLPQFVGLLDFIECYRLFLPKQGLSVQAGQQASITIQPGEPIIFEAENISNRPSGYIQWDGYASFTLQPAVYRITWRVPTSSPGTLVLVDADGNRVGESTISSSNQACEISNTVLFSPVQQTTISVINPGQRFDIPTTCGGVPLSYNIVIECIQELPTRVK